MPPVTTPKDKDRSSPQNVGYFITLADRQGTKTQQSRISGKFTSERATKLSTLWETSTDKKCQNDWYQQQW